MAPIVLAKVALALDATAFALLAGLIIYLCFDYHRIYRRT